VKAYSFDNRLVKARPRTLKGRKSNAMVTMRYPVGSLFVLLLATTALAASPRYYIVVGTGGYCFVVDSKPDAHSGLRIIGDKGGYDGLYAAKRALKSIPEDQCGGRFQ